MMSSDYFHYLVVKKSFYKAQGFAS